MTQSRVGLWNRAEAYERYMGRWSRRVAPLFLDWLATPDEVSWIDVGCGTGALSVAIIERCRPKRVVGIDTSEAFTEVARAQVHDDRFRTLTADGAALPVRDGEFSACVSGLVLNFVPDKVMALAERSGSSVRADRSASTCGTTRGTCRSCAGSSTPRTSWIRLLASSTTATTHRYADPSH